jgi:hypothetical protein
MRDRKEIIIAAGAGVALVSAAVLIFAVSALAGGINPGGQWAAGCGMTGSQEQASCPMVNGAAQDDTGNPDEYSESCH